MRSRRLVGWLILVVGCNSEDLVDGDVCGPKGECRTGYVCDLMQQCVLASSVRDAAGPDATRADATRADGSPSDGAVVDAPVVDAPVAAAPDAQSFDGPIDAFVDVSGPVTVLAGTPADGAFTNGRSAMFTFTSEAGARFRCSVDGAAPAACTSPQSYTTTATEGPHSFAVFALDALDNRGPTVSHAWTLDVTDPIVSLDGTPANGATTSSRSASFTFTSEAGATFACSRDGAAFAACTSPQTYTTSAVEGAHSFAVRATDRASNTGPTATRSWTLLTTGPTTTLGGTPAEGAATNQATSFTFTAPGAVRFECRQDSAAFDDCTSPVGYTLPSGGSADGTHSFSVRAFDALGNPGPVATRSFIWDTVGPPIASITGGPAEGALTNNPGFVFMFTATGADGFECEWDALGVHACPGQDPAPWTTVPSAQRDGAHTFQVRSRDALGNLGPTAVRHFSLDTVTPTTTITGPLPADLDDCPGTGPRLGIQVIVGSAITFTFTSNDPTADFLCFRDGSTSSEVCSSPYDWPNRNQLGAHSFSVRARDAANNQTNPFPGQGWTYVTACP